MRAQTDARAAMICNWLSASTESGHPRRSSYRGPKVLTREAGEGTMRSMVQGASARAAS
jgi:hypothetical protein